ncbi:MAG: nuclear transport factor 2 family protein [Hyphomicrobiales bacterium]
MREISSRPVADYVAATNAFDGDAMMALFTDDAIVNDIQREFVGQAAIRAWTDREIVGVKVTLEPVEARVHYGDEIVTFKIDGQFDRTGLPDPLLLTYYFTLRDDKICRLIILRNKPAS